jgi:serine protease Do
MYKFMALLLPALMLLGVAYAQERQPLSVPQVVERAKKGTVRVQTIDIGEEVASGGYGGGSGFLFEIDYDKGEGYVITNYHVAQKAAVCQLTFWDGATYRGDLVAREPGIDVALIRVIGLPDERDLPDSQKTIIPMVLGDSDQVQIGESGIGIGSPGADQAVGNKRGDPYSTLMLDQTVTANVVTGRDTPMEFFLAMWETAKSDLHYEYGTNFDYVFRMSTAINHGNSGGPLINAYDEVIGINFASFEGWLPGQNLNYAIPINLAKDFVFQILDTGKFEKPWLGLDILIPQIVKTPTDYSSFREKYQSDKEIIILGVRKGSPAAASGLLKDDVIITVDGIKFKSAIEIKKYVFGLDIGQKVEIVVKRKGSTLDPIEVEVAPKRHYDAEFSV